MSRREVAVVGAGPVGLVAALGLARAGADVTVLDTRTSPTPTWSGVLHNAVLPHLDSLGVLADVIDAGFTDPRWSVSVLRTGERIDFDLGDLQDRLAHPFNVHVETEALVSVLASHLTNVDWRRGVDVAGVRQDAEGVELALGDGSSLPAGWVVGADGTASGVRRAVGLGFPGTTWTERSVVAHVQHDFSAMGYSSSTFQVDEQHGAVVERIRDGVWRYTYAEAQSLPEAGIGARLDETLRAVVGHDVPVDAWAWDRMHQRTATSFRAGRVLLAGEAAHVANRLTGHRSISGFMDARDLSGALARVVRGEADPALLDEYAASRRRQFLDDASPASKDRLHLVSGLAGPSYDADLAAYRAARDDSDALEELVMLGVDGAASDQSF